MKVKSYNETSHVIKYKDNPVIEKKLVYWSTLYNGSILFFFQMSKKILSIKNVLSPLGLYPCQSKTQATWPCQTQASWIWRSCQIQEPSRPKATMPN